MAHDEKIAAIALSLVIPQLQLLVFLVVIPEGNLLLRLLLPVLLAVIPAANPLSRTPTTLHEST